jgi:hypothetical protein
MVIVAQLVRASDCGSEGRGFETRLSPLNKKSVEVIQRFFKFYNLSTTGRFSLLARSHTIAKASLARFAKASYSIF